MSRGAGKCSDCVFRGVTRCTLRIDACLKPEIIPWKKKYDYDTSDKSLRRQDPKGIGKSANTHSDTVERRGKPHGEPRLYKELAIPPR